MNRERETEPARGCALACAQTHRMLIRRVFIFSSTLDWRASRGRPPSLGRGARGRDTEKSDLDGKKLDGRRRDAMVDGVLQRLLEMVCARSWRLVGGDDVMGQRVNTNHVGGRLRLTRIDFALSP